MSAHAAPSLRPPYAEASACSQPRAQVTYRRGRRADAHALHALIARHVEEAHLLPRSLADLERHAARFVVALRSGRLVGCAELAPLSADVAEVRSLVVDVTARASGVGRQLLVRLGARARAQRVDRLCAFAHDPGFFQRLGFIVVPHAAVPEKIARDCTGCALYRRCGQHALVRAVGSSGRSRRGADVTIGGPRP